MIHRLLRVLSASVFLTLLALPDQAAAIPHWSLTAGTPCAACHVDYSGGGMRTDLGWRADSALTWSDIGLDALQAESNAYFDEYLSIGFDARLQVVKLGRPTTELDQETGQQVVIEPTRRVLPMQVQPYLSSYLTDWLRLYGTWAAGPNTFRDGDLCDTVYSGQSCWIAFAQIQPTYTSPKFQIGKIRPSIGIRRDDHTILLLADALRPRQPAIAPNYAEFGAEMAYQPVSWFETVVGGYSAKELSEAIGSPYVEESDISVLGKFTLLPRLTDQVTSWLGTSLLMTGFGNYRLENYYVGLGLLNQASLQFEASRGIRSSKDTNDERSLNLFLKLAYNITPWLIAEGRIERATTLVTALDGTETDAEVDSAVVGLQFFPITYVEIRPEYRYFKRRDEYTTGQYTLQLHLYY